jgi:hypothetical protein
MQAFVPAETLYLSKPRTDSMIDTTRLASRLSEGRSPDPEIGPEPTKEDLRTVVQQLKSEGICGRRIAEHRLGPYFIASDAHGQREIELLDDVLNEEFAGTDLCIETRKSECSRLRGGCKGSR